MTRRGEWARAQGAAAGALGSPGLATGDKASGDCDPLEDSERRESFVQLRARYVEAQKLVSSDEPFANLEWILGARRNITQDPLGLETKTIELAALWLQDLAVEVDHRGPKARPHGASMAGPRDEATDRLRRRGRGPMEVGWFPCTRLCSLLERNAQAFRSRSEAIRIDQDPRAGNFVGRGLPQRRHPDEPRELRETGGLRRE